MNFLKLPSKLEIRMNNLIHKFKITAYIHLNSITRYVVKMQVHNVNQAWFNNVPDNAYLMRCRIWTFVTYSLPTFSQKFWCLTHVQPTCDPTSCSETDQISNFLDKYFSYFYLIHRISNNKNICWAMHRILTNQKKHLC